jgi:hypothetical protein
MTTRVHLTYVDYAALPNDGRRYEVHEGELAVTPAPGPIHQELIGNLAARLAGTRAAALPPFADLALDPDLVWP